MLQALRVAAACAAGMLALSCLASEGTAELDELRLRMSELERRLQKVSDSVALPLREAVEDYLEDRGVSGPTWTNERLAPLERSLRRITLGGELHTHYERWNNLLDLNEASSDRVDFLESRLHLWSSYALTDGPELEFELRGMLRSEAVSHDGPSGLFPPEVGSPGFDPYPFFESLPELELTRAELRLPSFNLLGRLAHLPTTLVLGRQELSFGEGFLLGKELSYDGVRATCETGSGTRFDMFWVKATSASSRAIASRIDGPVDPTSTIDAELSGLRLELRGALPDTMVAGYLVSAKLGEIFASDPLHYEAYSGPTVYSIGAECIVALAPGASLRLEAASQWGEFGTRTIRDAYAAEAKLKLEKGPGEKYELFAAFATGDRTSTTNLHEGFLPLAQDVRGRFEPFGLLSLRNIGLWGARANISGSGRQPEFMIGFAQAFADEPDSPEGSGFLLSGGTGGGNRLGEILSVGASWALYGERPARGAPSCEMHLVASVFFPEEYFDPSARDPVVIFSFGFRAGF